MRSIKDLFTFSLTVLLTATFISCAKKATVKKASDVTPELAATPEQEDVEASLRGKDFSDLSGLQVVYFDLDSSSLRDDTRTAIEANAQFLQAHPALEVRLDGHCDERGTTAYNLALGQRRSAAVRSYLKSLGVSGKRMATLSWGEEKSTCSTPDEACWAKDRRV